MTAEDAVKEFCEKSKIMDIKFTEFLQEKLDEAELKGWEKGYKQASEDDKAWDKIVNFLNWREIC